MAYNISEIAKIISGNTISKAKNDILIEHLVFDTRQAFFSHNSLFFSISGKNNDGHAYIYNAYKKGICCFIIEKELNTLPKDCWIIQVSNSINAMQKIAAYHRKNLLIPITAITGSNGKTIIKEWLYALLKNSVNIYRSPKSYNSQIGVPYSLWQIKNTHESAIIEAGISYPDEMINLEQCIKPDIGIISNILSAHDANFDNQLHKTNEKIKLFSTCHTIIYRADYNIIDTEIKKLYKTKNLITWSINNNNRAKYTVKFTINTKSNSTDISITNKNNKYQFKIPFIDNASAENAIFCAIYLIENNYWQTKTSNLFEKLEPIEMRLNISKGINNCTLINDSYSSDIESLKIAINVLNQQKQHTQRTIILSDLQQTGIDNKTLYNNIALLLNTENINKIIGIGENLYKHASYFSASESYFYSTTNQFIENYSNISFNNEAVLIKGARKFGFEKIEKLFQQQTHITALEINLNALIHNYNYFKSLLMPKTKIMAMVKAYSYGSGSYEIANILAYYHVDYLGVAYTDEGIELRKNGIKTPIMVMSPEAESFESIIQFNLEPEIYSFDILQKFISFLSKEQLMPPYPIHIKIDTGMHRLGFESQDINQLIDILKTHQKTIQIKSIFSHLAASDDKNYDAFTQHQLCVFKTISKQIEENLNIQTIKHIANSMGIIRHKDTHIDMVRLGIGMYGIASDIKTQKQLEEVYTLKTTISQIKTIPKFDTIGYNRQGKINKNSKIATIPVGYADGLNRLLSNGNGYVMINNNKAPIIGNICMDMCMIDISEINAKTGDEVIVFGKKPSIQEVAQKAQTIPYEILTNISPRVKRIYLSD